MPRNFLAHGPNAAEVGAAVRALRRSDGDEDQLRVGDPRRQVGREPQTAVASVPMNQFGQARLVDRHFAAFKHRDLRRDLVHADDVVAALRQASAGHQADVTGSNHGNLHKTISQSKNVNGEDVAGTRSPTNDASRDRLESRS